MNCPRLVLPLFTAAFASCAASAQPNVAQEVVPGVFFHEGDRTRGHCNNGWIVFDDHVLVIDANYPSGALEIMPKIQANSDRPVRFVFNTHHHGDHAYGNLLWVTNGATVVATSGALEEMKRVETGLFGGAPGRWENQARTRPDVAASRLAAPTLLFAELLAIEDRHRRVELRWFGVAHTAGDGFAWLPKEKILFTGDSCVNGPFNFVGDSHYGEWVRTLAKLEALGPEIVCPGHGPRGGPEIIAGQRGYFQHLLRRAQELRDAGRAPEDAKAAVEALRAELVQDALVSRWVGGGLAGHFEKAWTELGGAPFPR